MEEENESIVKYRDGEDGPDRIIRGKIIEQNDTEIKIERDDGIYTIQKKYLIWMKESK